MIKKREKTKMKISIRDKSEKLSKKNKNTK